MDHADREWRLIPAESRPGPLHMALDEVAARTAAQQGTCTCRVYRWEPSTLSLGYHQDPDTVDWGFCEREGITVTRRPTGGGAIYHDSWGDVSYSIVAPADDFPGDLMDSYQVLCEPILGALASLGVEAGFASETRPAVYGPACYLRAIHPAHDVVVDGRKLSGNAQYRQKDAVIQHGSITFERASERHLACFADPGVGSTEFDERVISVREAAGVERDDLVATLEGTLAEWSGADEGNWADEELSRARDLAAEKYEDEGWVREGEDPLA